MASVVIRTVGLLLISNVFMTFAWLYLMEPVRLNYLWAGLCMLGAVHFVFRK